MCSSIQSGSTHGERAFFKRKKKKKKKKMGGKKPWRQWRTRNEIVKEVTMPRREVTSLHQSNSITGNAYAQSPVTRASYEACTSTQMTDNRRRERERERELLFLKVIAQKWQPLLTIINESCSTNRAILRLLRQTITISLCLLVET